MQTHRHSLGDLLLVSKLRHGCQHRVLGLLLPQVWHCRVLLLLPAGVLVGRELRPTSRSHQWLGLDSSL